MGEIDDIRSNEMSVLGEVRACAVDGASRSVIEPRIRYRGDLDGLRAMAVGLVIVSHAVVPVSNAGGDVGVTAFFVLSGYLITGLLLDERESKGRVDLRDFYVRRVRRLGPALLVLLVFAVLLGIAGGWPDRWTIGLVSSLLYVANWVQAANVPIGILGHTWTLSIEEQFYLLWPVFLLAAGPSRAVKVAVALAIIAAVTRTVATGPVEYFSTFARADAILVGCVLSIVRVRLPSTVGAAGAMALVVVAYLDLPHDLTIPLAIAAASAVVTGPWRPLGLLAPMGRRAYGLYLWNYPMQGLLGAFAIPATFLAAELSWRLVERPILGRRRQVPTSAAPAMSNASPVNAMATPN